MENKADYTNIKYSTIEEMKENLDIYNLPYLKNNYFVKKTEIMLNKIEDRIRR